MLRLPFLRLYPLFQSIIIDSVSHSKRLSGDIYRTIEASITDLDAVYDQNNVGQALAAEKGGLTGKRQMFDKGMILSSKSKISH